MNSVITLNGVIAFTLELIMLAAYGMAGYRLSSTPWLQWVLAAVPIIVVAVLWGMFAAPRANWRLGSPWLYLFGGALMLIGFAALWRMGYHTVASICSVAAIASQVIAYVTKQ